MYDDMKRHEVRVLRKAGFSLREVGAQAEVGLSTVVRILDETEPVEVPARRSVGRPPIAVRFEEPARLILQEDAHLPTVEIMRRLRQQGYTGGKNPVYRLVRRLRPIVTRPMVRFEGVAGEFSQDDFGQCRVKYDDGTVEIIHFFAGRLKWSRWMYVEIVENEQVESLVRALLSSFESFGGVPLLCVFDNPSTVVTSRLGNVIEWNDTFAQVALDYRFAAELCWPRKGNQKGSVSRWSWLDVKPVPT